jgi:hypothetical protein
MKERRRKEKDEGKKKKMRDTWHLVSGWEEIMKSSLANWIVTCGRGRLLFHFKPSTYVN